jgi:hypothetical protein
MDARGTPERTFNCWRHRLIHRYQAIAKGDPNKTMIQQSLYLTAWHIVPCLPHKNGDKAGTQGDIAVLLDLALCPIPY